MELCVSESELKTHTHTHTHRDTHTLGVLQNVEVLHTSWSVQLRKLLLKRAIVPHSKTPLSKSVKPPSEFKQAKVPCHCPLCLPS